MTYFRNFYIIYMIMKLIYCLANYPYAAHTFSHFPKNVAWQLQISMSHLKRRHSLKDGVENPVLLPTISKWPTDVKNIFPIQRCVNNVLFSLLGKPKLQRFLISKCKSSCSRFLSLRATIWDLMGVFRPLFALLWMIPGLKRIRMTVWGADEQKGSLNKATPW